MKWIILLLLFPSICCCQKINHGTTGIVYLSADTIFVAMDTKGSGVHPYELTRKTHKISMQDNIGFATASLDFVYDSGKYIFNGSSLIRSCIVGQDIYDIVKKTDSTVLKKLTDTFKYLYKNNIKNFLLYLTTNTSFRSVFEYSIFCYYKEKPICFIRRYYLTGDTPMKAVIKLYDSVQLEVNQIGFLGEFIIAQSAIINDKAFFKRKESMEYKFAKIIKQVSDSSIYVGMPIDVMKITNNWSKIILDYDPF